MKVKILKQQTNVCSLNQKLPNFYNFSSSVDEKFPSGIHKGIREMKKGEIRIFRIIGNKWGLNNKQRKEKSIPENSILFYEIELIEFKNVSGQNFLRIFEIFFFFYRFNQLLQ